MFHKLCNTAIRESLNIESLLLRIERSQLKCLVMWAECLRNGLPSKLCILKLVERGQVYNHEQDDLITLRILVGTIWDFIQAKCSQCCWIERCGSLNWSCCPRNPKKQRWKKWKDKKKKTGLSSYVLYNNNKDCFSKFLRVKYSLWGPKEQLSLFFQLVDNYS